MKLLGRIVREAILRHELEREALQRITDEERRRFVVFDVACGFTASQDVIVHARQIVVHQ